MMLSFTGVSAGFVFSMAGLDLCKDGDAIWATLMIAAFLKGCTEIQYSALPSAVNDVIRDEQELYKAFAGIISLQALAALFGNLTFAMVLFQTLTDYTGVFAFASGIALLSLLFVVLFFPETLPERERKAIEWNEATPCLGAYPYLLGAPSDLHVHHCLLFCLPHRRLHRRRPPVPAKPIRPVPGASRHGDCNLQLALQLGRGMLHLLYPLRGG